MVQVINLNLKYFKMFEAMGLNAVASKSPAMAPAYVVVRD
jgi:hypothetical protein